MKAILLVGALFVSSVAQADLPAVRCESIFRQDPQVEIRIESSFGGFAQQDALLLVEDGEGASVNERFTVWSDTFGFNRVNYRGTNLDFTLEIDLGWDRAPQEFRSYDATLRTSKVRDGKPVDRLRCEFSRF